MWNFNVCGHSCLGCRFMYPQKRCIRRTNSKQPSLLSHMDEKALRSEVRGAALDKFFHSVWPSLWFITISWCIWQWPVSLQPSEIKPVCVWQLTPVLHFWKDKKPRRQCEVMKRAFISSTTCTKVHTSVFLKTQVHQNGRGHKDKE